MHDAEQTFRCFVGARLPALKRAAWLLTGDVHLAEDLVQTALAKVAMRWERVAAGGDPEPYVRKVLYHEYVSAGRKRRFVEVPEGLSPGLPMTYKGCTAKRPRTAAGHPRGDLPMYGQSFRGSRGDRTQHAW